MPNLINPLSAAIEQKNPDIVRFLLSTGMPVESDAVNAALKSGDPAILELLAEEMRALLPNWNVLKSAPDLTTARWFVEHGFPVDLAEPQSEKFPYELNDDPEVAAYLKACYRQKHPVLQPVAAGMPDAQWQALTPEFTNTQLTVQELHAVNYNPSTGVFEIEFDGCIYLASKRFLSSLARKLKVSSNIFRYFSGEEVLNRAAERNPELAFRVTFDHRRSQILGVVDANKRILPPEIAYRIFADDPRTQKLSYQDGVLTAEMMLNEGFTIDGDSEYQRKITLRYPVDGLSMPSIFLAVERQICTNGATALVNAFRTEIEINDHSGTHLSRLVSSFSNENGFHVLENRLRKAQSTTASVREIVALQELLSTQIDSRSYFNKVNERLEALAGDPCANYEVTSLNNIPQKRRALLPVQCSVNDLINFCSELTTHHRERLASPDVFHASIGRTLAQEFDLEEMYSHRGNARDFYLNGLEEEEERKWA